MITSHIFELVAGYASGMLVIFSLILYLRAILQGRVHSNSVTWGIWVIVTGMLAISYYQSVGFVAAIWVSLATFIGTLLIFIFLLVCAPRGAWTWVEKTSIFAIVLIIPLWIFFHDPLLALTLTMLVDIFGAIPLVHTLYFDHTSEDGPAWVLAFIANILNLFAVEQWDYAHATYPLYLAFLTFVITGLIYFPIFFGPKFKGAKS